MPKLTRFYLKSSLVYLTAALLLSLLLALPASWPLPAFIRAMNPAFFHLFLVGWVTQMIFGVIFWMFPIISRARPRGNEKAGWISYLLLNVGLLLRIAAEPLLTVRPSSPLGWLLALSALLQWLGATVFVIMAWPRVKERYRGE